MLRGKLLAQMLRRSFSASGSTPRIFQTHMLIRQEIDCRILL
jgi:hypothetical protein